MDAWRRGEWKTGSTADRVMMALIEIAILERCRHAGADFQACLLQWNNEDAGGHKL